MTETATVLLALAWLVLPGVAVARWTAADAPALARWGLGASLGLALLVIRATVLHGGGWLGAPWVPAFEVGLGAVAATTLIWAAVRARAALPRRAALALAIVVIVGAALRLGLHHGAAIALDTYDTPAHATLSMALWLNPGEPTWAPFMDAQPHYPWGAHAVVGLLHQVTGVSIHGVLTVLTSAGVGVLTVLVMAGLARTLSEDDAVAVGAAFLVAVCGKPFLLVAEWGGYPSEVGLTLVAGIGLALLIARDAAPSIAVALPLTTLALLWSHHLSAVIGAVAIGVPFVAMVVDEPKVRPAAARAVLGVFVAAAVAIPMWTVVLDVDVTGDTAAFSMPRHMDLVGSLPAAVGAWVLVFAGIALATDAIPAGRTRVVLLGAVAGLAIGFTVCLPLAKLATLSDGASAILVPSRWLGSLAFPLAIVGGAGVAFAWRRWSRWRVPATVALVAAGLVSVWGARRPELDPAAWGAHQRAGELVGDGGVVLSHTRDRRWAGYASGRTASSVPAPPGSDPLTARARAIDALLAPALGGVPKPAWVGVPTAVVVDLRARTPAASAFLRPMERHGPHALFLWQAPDAVSEEGRP